MYIALGNDYLNYKSALETTNLETLVLRRSKLCTTFAVKTSKHPKHSEWFVKSDPGPNTRSKKPNYKIPLCRLSRTKKGPIPYLKSPLNSIEWMYINKHKQTLPNSYSAKQATRRSELWQLREWDLIALHCFVCNHYLCCLSLC